MNQKMMLGRKKNKQQASGRKAPRLDGQQANVFSYHASRSRPAVDRGRGESPLSTLPKSSNRNWLKYLPSIVACVAIVVSLIYITILDTTNPKIVPLSEKSPSILRTTDDYANGVEEIMSHSIFNRSKLTISSDNIAKQIREMYPELGEVSVTIPLLSKRPIIEISPSEPMLTLTTQEGSYVVNNQGKALLLLSDLPSGQDFHLIRVVDQVGLDIETGKTVLPISTIEFIQALRYQFDAKKQPINELRLPTIANELHLQPTGQSYIIKFNLQNDVLQQVGSYFALVESLNSKGQALPKEYIDVRVDGRIYYK